jgi:hypothetical protein
LVTPVQLSGEPAIVKKDQENYQCNNYKQENAFDKYPGYKPQHKKSDY